MSCSLYVGFIWRSTRRSASFLFSLTRPAIEKRQGTKSRWVMQRRCRGRYGDLAAVTALIILDRSGWSDRFVVSPGIERLAARCAATFAAGQQARLAAWRERRHCRSSAARATGASTIVDQE
jgi:hypothetical protein